MNPIAIYTLTSELHDEAAVAAVTHSFLGSLPFDFDLKGADYGDYGHAPLNLIYVRTGGTEAIFLKLLPLLRQKSDRPIFLLTSGKSNSLAASMEILSFLQQQQIDGEIIHGSPSYIGRRVEMLLKSEQARHQLNGMRLGVIGKPSDWLISSQVEPTAILQKLGIELIDIDIKELLDETTNVRHEDTLTGAEHIYDALEKIVDRYQLQGFTLRCFDLLSAVHNTGCLALARINAEDKVAGCEGDVPALLSMAVCKQLVGVSGFQANPAHIDPDTGEMLFAHCTIPFNMVERYEQDTHFESGIGIGIRGFMKPGPVTLFKLSPDLSRHYIAEGELLRNQSKPDLCRTQQVIRLQQPEQVGYFLTRPIGNHHIILPGHQGELLTTFLSQCKLL